MDGFSLLTTEFRSQSSIGEKQSRSGSGPQGVMKVVERPNLLIVGLGLFFPPIFYFNDFNIKDKK